MDIKIKNATVITNNQADEVLFDAEIHIKNGLIAYVGTSAPAYVAQREIDAGGNIVMPGFFNMHTHIPMTLLRCYADDMSLQDWLFNKMFPAEEKLTDEMVYWSSLASLCEFAAAGIVGFNEMYDHCGAIAKAVEQSGHRAQIARGVVAFTPEMGEEKVREGLEFYERYHNTGRIKVYMSPHAQYTVDDGTLQKLVQLAKKLKTGIHSHVSETKKEHEECIEKTGKTPVALYESLGLLDVPFIGAHCVWVSEEDIQILAAHGAAVASCPRSNLKLASGIAPLTKMMDAGVNVTLGTDSAASNNKLSMMSEMTYASFLQKGSTYNPQAMPAGLALKTATLHGAQAMGLDSGTLEVGKNADIIMLDTSGIRFAPQYDVLASVAYATSDSDVCMTMVGGDILYENGKCTFADVGEIKERLEAYSKIIK